MSITENSNRNRKNASNSYSNSNSNSNSYSPSKGHSNRNGNPNIRSRRSSRGKSALLAAVTAAVLLLAACGGNNGGGNDGGSGADAEGKLSVVTSIYPLYFLASEIGGDRVNAVNLVPAGVEPHDWTPKSKDLTRVSQADLFLYNGAGLEGWTDEFLDGIEADSGVRVVEASAGIPLLPGNPEEAHGHDEAEDADAHAGEDADAHAGEDADAHAGEDADAHAGEDADAHAGEDADAHAGEDADAHAGEEAEPQAVHTVDDGHDHDTGVDPHTWVSPKSMMLMAETVKAQFAAADPANAAAYEAGYIALRSRLSDLDGAYEQSLSNVKRRDIIVSHQAFGYLCRDYGLNQIAIMGLSPEAEPKAQDLARIAKEAKENGIKYIFFEELVSADLARTLADEAGAEVLVLNPVEGLTPEQEAKGEDYVTIMQTNLQNLLKALQ